MRTPRTDHSVVVACRSVHPREYVSGESDESDEDDEGDAGSDYATTPETSETHYAHGMGPQDRRRFVLVALDVAREKLRSYRLVSIGCRGFLSRLALRTNLGPRPCLESGVRDHQPSVTTNPPETPAPGPSLSLRVPAPRGCREDSRVYPWDDR